MVGSSFSNGSEVRGDGYSRVDWWIIVSFLRDRYGYRKSHWRRLCHWCRCHINASPNLSGRTKAAVIVPHMSIEVVFSCVVLVALWEWALERTLSSVSWHMPSEILVVNKALATLFTLIGPICTACMISLVMSVAKQMLA
jgi:hypothetical protein